MMRQRQVLTNASSSWVTATVTLHVLLPHKRHFGAEQPQFDVDAEVFAFLELRQNSQGKEHTGYISLPQSAEAAEPS